MFVAICRVITDTLKDLGHAWGTQIVFGFDTILKARVFTDVLACHFSKIPYPLQ
jgi:hypothetical protein